MNKKLLIGCIILCGALMLASCSSDEDTQETTDAVTTAPEDGVVYEYSKGGNSDVVMSSVTYEGGVEVSRNTYDYWTGGKLKSITTTVDGEVTDIWSYLYNEDGILIQMVREYTDSSDGAKCRDDYRYDGKGNLTDFICFANDVIYGSEKYSYTEKGALTRHETLDANGDVIKYTAYTLDEKELCQRTESYMYGSLFSYSVYAYNDKGQLSEISTYTGSNALTGTVRNEYNDKGQLVRISDMDADGNINGYTECLYDDEGFNYRDIFYEDGKPVYCYDYTEDGARIYSSYN